MKIILSVRFPKANPLAISRPCCVLMPHRRNSHATRGSALIIALVCATVAMAILLGVTEHSRINTVGVNNYLDQQSANLSAQGAANLVVSDIWSKYLETAEVGDPNFRTFLTNNYPVINNSFSTLSNWNNKRFGQSIISSVKLTRKDRDSSTGFLKNSDLWIDAEVTTDSGVKVWATRVISTSNPSDYKGFDYGVLTKNISCTFCHMKVQSLDKITNTSSSNYGTYERVKVGTTEMLAMRASSASSCIEGTLYQRGRFEDEMSGTTQTLANLTGSTIKCTAFNTSQTTEQQVASNGATIQANFTNSGTNPATGAPYPKENVYLNYPTNPDTMAAADGELPTTFPSPFPDTNNNRKIDAAELTEAQSTATGSLTGGIATLVATGGTYNAAIMPTSGSAAAVTGSQSGNMILVGTVDNPIKISGKVVIDGDVMIKGYVEGNGSIFAKGNIYMPNDVKYNNKLDSSGKEIFGVTPTGGPNLIAFASGKNIIVGDYLSSVNHWDSSQSKFFNYGVPEPGKKIPNYALPYTNTNGSLDSGTQVIGGITYGKVNFANFVVEELAFFNREELTKTLTKVPTSTPSSKYYDSTTPYITVASKYTTTNPKYDVSFTPRYYTLYSAGAAVSAATNPPVYMNDKQKWDTTKNFWTNTQDPHTYNTMRELAEIPSQNATAVANKVQLNIHPEWITPGNMLNLLLKEESSRTAATPRRVDGLMYTNNAIFAIERKQTQSYSGVWNTGTQTYSGGTWSKVATKSGGKMIVNGGIIAPDLGVLVTGGTTTSSSPFANGYPIQKSGVTTYEQKAFTVNYDKRIRELIDIQNTTQTNWGIASKGWAKNTGSVH